MPLRPISATKFLALLSEGQERIFREEVYPVFKRYFAIIQTLDEDTLRWISDSSPLLIRGHPIFVRMAMCVFKNRSDKDERVRIKSHRDGRFNLCIVRGFDSLMLTFYTEVVIAW